MIIPLHFGPFKTLQFGSVLVWITLRLTPLKNVLLDSAPLVTVFVFLLTPLCTLNALQRGRSFTNSLIVVSAVRLPMVGLPSSLANRVVL
jgi:hypothetical protein